MPVAGSGVILGVWKVPKGVASARPPASSAAAVPLVGVAGHAAAEPQHVRAARGVAGRGDVRRRAAPRHQQPRRQRDEHDDRTCDQPAHAASILARELSSENSPGLARGEHGPPAQVARGAATGAAGAVAESRVAARSRARLAASSSRASAARARRRRRRGAGGGQNSRVGRCRRHRDRLGSSGRASRASLAATSRHAAAARVSGGAAAAWKAILGAVCGQHGVRRSWRCRGRRTRTTNRPSRCALAGGSGQSGWWPRFSSQLRRKAISSSCAAMIASASARISGSWP